ASQPHGVMAFLKTAPDLPMPDIQLLCSAAPLTAAPYFRPFVAPYEDSFACRAVLLRPESRGQVTLTSRDPKQAPRIRQNFLARENDWVTLRAGVQLARDIGRQTPLAPFVASEIGPGPGCRSDAEIDAYIRATAITRDHLGAALDQFAAQLDDPGAQMAFTSIRATAPERASGEAAERHRQQAIAIARQFGVPVHPAGTHSLFNWDGTALDGDTEAY